MSTPLRAPRRSIIAEPLEPRQLLAAGFNIQVQFSGIINIKPEKVVVNQAAARWESILLEDIPDVEEGGWGDPVDDLRIVAMASNIDGPGGVLGSADTQFRRPGSGLTINGVIRVDLADLSNPGLVDIVTHEIGHILGIGSLWSNFGLISGAGGSDPIYTGAQGLAQYRIMAANSSLASVPVENTGEIGTRDLHWRESSFYNELMTGYYNLNVINPLSRLSAASLIDIGYPGVNLDAATPYNLPGGNQVPTIGSLSVSSSASLPNSTITLTASSVADLTGGVARVRFYRETNGIPGLQASGNLTSFDQLVSTDTAGPGWTATLDLTGLPIGSYTYYAQVNDVHGAVSAIATAAHEVGVPPPVPAAPLLAASSDGGFSDSDRITSDGTPTLFGTAAAGTVVHVFADGTEIGQSTTDAGGAWSFTPTATLGDGVRSITVTAQSGSFASAASTPLLVTIDTLAPQVTASTFIYLTALGATFTFNENVADSLSGGDLVFQNTTSGVPYSAVLAGYDGNVARFTFGAFPPPKGDYIATLAAAGVTDLAGNALASAASVSFFYLPGDVNRSRGVDFDDLLIISQRYGLVGNAAEGDLNYNGTVDFDDLLMLSQNYGQSLLAAMQPAATTPAKRTRAAAVVR